jgi:hypothetical protein
MNRMTRWLAVAGIFQAGVIAGLLAARGGSGGGAGGMDPMMPRTVSAQVIPDPAAQQIITNELLRGIDAKVAKISDTMSSAEMKVKVTNLPPAK